MIIPVRSTANTFALAVVAGLSAMSASPAVAGRANPSDCGCRPDPTGGGGYCWGTLQCFRQLPDPNAFAQMSAQYLSASQQVQFSASFNNQTYQCYARGPEPCACGAVGRRRLGLAQCLLGVVGPFRDLPADLRRS